VVGHTSRTGSARANETLSRQRAELVQKLLEQNTRALSARLSASGVGSKEALVGLGTDDLRDALDRRVEFRVIDCV
jgi:outer membrane protein OmpA-like peptidoglycan-associated protein